MSVFFIFPNSEIVPDILKLADTPQWECTHMNLTVDRPRVEIIPIIAKLLGDRALEEGEEYEFIPIELLEPKGTAQFSTSKKEEVPAAALLAYQIKSLQTEELKQILSALSQELESRQVPNRSPLYQSQGLLGNVAWALAVGVGGRLGSLPYTKKNGVSAVAKFGVIL